MSKPTTRELREMIEPGPRTEEMERESNAILGLALFVFVGLTLWAVVLATYWTLR